MNTKLAVEAKRKLICTRPILQRVLPTGISGWLYTGDTFTLAPETYPPEIHR